MCCELTASFDDSLVWWLDKQNTEPETLVPRERRDDGSRLAAKTPSERPGLPWCLGMLLRSYNMEEGIKRSAPHLFKYLNTSEAVL